MFFRSSVQLRIALVDPDEFMSDFGLRSLSRVHLHAPFVLGGNAVNYREAGEADCKIKGGNSNWRGPIWFPTAFLMIESLRKLAKAYGDDFAVIRQTRPYLDARRNREDAGRSSDRRFSRAMPRWSSAGVTAISRSSRKIRAGVTTSRFTNTSTAIPASASVHRIRTGWTGLRRFR
jgi:hypothetical protein